MMLINLIDLTFTMKYSVIFTMLAFLIIGTSTSAQKQLPAATVVDKDGKEINLKSYVTDGNPKIVSLWATWCGPCRMELNALKKAYPRWQEKYGLEIVTVSVDIPNMVNRAKKMFEQNGWEYTFLHDNKQELMAKMGLRGIPYSMLIDGEGNVKSVQMGFSAGYEDQIEEKLKSM